MRRIRLCVFIILGLVITIAPVVAQSETITEIVDSNPDWEWLQYAFESAPEVLEQINDGNSYTFFAPTDAGFENLVSNLEIPLQELLSDSELATAILKYHLVEGALSEEEIGERSGEVMPTLLTSAFVSFQLNDSSITINNTVAVASSQEATNGYVYVVNSVLVNRSINNLIDARVAEYRASLSSPTDTPTPEPTATEAVTEIPLQVSNLRFAHFAVDIPALDIYLNDARIFENLESESVSAFSSLVADDYEISIVLNEAETPDTLIEPINISMADGDFLTLVLTGSLENDSLSATVITEDYSELESDSRILVYNGLEDAPELDIAFDDDMLIEGLGSNDSSVQDLDAGNYNFSVYLSGDSENSIFEEADFELATDDYTFIALAGTTDNISLVATSTDIATIESLGQGANLSGGQVSEITETPQPPVTDTVLDILLADDKFSLFVEALETGDSSVINRLASRNLSNITVLAPSNEAFENLFSSVTRGQNRIFGNRNVLTQVLQYHLVEGELLASDFEAAKGTSIITLLQPVQAFRVSSVDGVILLNRNASFRGVELIEVDILASNGVLHVVDNVLLPQVALDAWGL